MYVKLYLFVEFSLLNASSFYIISFGLYFTSYLVNYLYIVYTQNVTVLPTYVLVLYMHNALGVNAIIIIIIIIIINDVTIH